MFDRARLISTGLPPLFDSVLEDFAHQCRRGMIYQGNHVRERFLDIAPHYWSHSHHVELTGLSDLRIRDVIIGCNHFIDNLIMQHGLDGLQIFEHDYTYYRRLDPNIIYATPGELLPDRPVLIAAPFPGALDLHPRWHDILDECDAKGIPVHIDGSWLGAASGVSLDLTRPCVKSLALSLSKGQGLHWNRIGIRFSREILTDSITIMNQHHMIPEILMRVGVQAMSCIPRDYLWDTYGQKYHAICRQLRLRPTAIIHAAMSLDRSQLLGLKDLLHD